jgi:hypothetical protein
MICRRREFVVAMGALMAWDWANGSANAVSLANTPDVAQRATMVADGSFPAALQAVDVQWQIAFLVGSQVRQVPAASLIQWGACVEKPQEPALILANGNGLIGIAPNALRLASGKFVAETSCFGELQIPQEQLSGVVLRPPIDRLKYDLLRDRLSASGPRQDRVLLTNGDETAGTLESFDKQKFALRTGVGSIAIDAVRVEAVAFGSLLGRRPSPAAKSLQAWVGLSDGSRILVDRLIVQGQTAQLSLPGGAVWNVAPSEIVFLQPIGSIVYLSDKRPTSYRSVPFLNLPWPYHADRNVAGGLLRAGGHVCLKGIGMHSAARLSYALDKPFKRFEAELAIDDYVAGDGSVRFRVFVDGQPKYASTVVRGNTPPVPVQVDIAGVKQIDLVVDYAERGDQRDYADWLGARLIP